MNEPADEAPVTVEHRGNLAVLRLNRPDTYNALNLEMGDALLEALVACDQDDAVRAVLLTGTGKAFCSGGDIREMRSFESPEGYAGGYLKRLTVRLHASLATLLGMEKPVVTAVNGPAAGAGFSLALAGDMVMASEAASFTVAYTAIGLAPDGGSTYFLPRMVGPKRAFELMATNRVLTPADAMDLGIINRTAPADGFEAEAMALAQSLADGPTRALGYTKRLLLSGQDGGVETAMEQERRAIAACGGTADFVAGKAAFLAKSKAVFAGR